MMEGGGSSSAEDVDIVAARIEEVHNWKDTNVAESKIRSQVEEITAQLKNHHFLRSDLPDGARCPLSLLLRSPQTICGNLIDILLISYRNF